VETLYQQKIQDFLSLKVNLDHFIFLQHGLVVEFGQEQVANGKLILLGVLVKDSSVQLEIVEQLPTTLEFNVKESVVKLLQPLQNSLFPILQSTTISTIFQMLTDGTSTSPSSPLVEPESPTLEMHQNSTVEIQNVTLTQIVVQMN